FMLHDIDFPNDMQAHFFRAAMTDGIIEIPPFKALEVNK
ncbi:MAG: type I-C CRISPR-associated protein Cas5, partial [archaeon]